KIPREPEPDDEAKGLFLQEAEALQALGDHPYIVRFVETGSFDNGCPYIVTQWIPGENLEAIIMRHEQRHEWLTERTVVLMGLQIAEALSFAHRRSWMHRDVKPANAVLESGDLAN